MGDRVVEYRARRETEIQRALAFLRPLAGNDSGRRIQRFGCCRQQLGKLAVLLGRIGGSRLQQFGDAELILAARALAPRRRDLAYLWRGVIEHLREFDAGLTVDPAVMSLGIKGDQSAFQAIDDVHLPQRTTAIEQRGVHPVQLVHLLASLEFLTCFPAAARLSRSAITSNAARGVA